MPLTCLDAPPPNVVLLVLDDGRADQVEVMPEALDRLAARGMTFERAYAPTPLCAPSRASLLSGGWSASATGVLTNELPNGGAARFVDTDTLATRLAARGYTTALIGKYLNGYDADARHVPPGWSVWRVWDSGGEDWYDNVVVTGGSPPDAATTGTIERPEGYATDVMAAMAVDFLREQGSAPFFLDVSFFAPHDPHQPAPEDADAFPGYTYAGGAYQEADVSDKPGWVQAQRLLRPEEEEEAWAVDRERLQTLLSVDRAIGAILDALDEAGLAESTVVVLTSDNGQLWGEHRLFEKGQPYEESARVPLVVFHPALPGGRDARLVAAPLDLAATVAGLAGLPATGDGLDLGPALCGEATAWRDSLLLQSWSTGTPDWAAIRTDTATYVAWATGEEELYLPADDPFEEESRHADPALAATRAGLADPLADARALTVAPVDLPGARTGVAYAATLSTWGGTAPLTWALHAGSLPPGLVLTADGRIEGTPRAPGDHSFEVTVRDSSRSPLTGRPQEVTAAIRLVVTGDAECGCGGAAPTGWVWLAALALTRRGSRRA